MLKKSNSQIHSSNSIKLLLLKFSIFLTLCIELTSVPKDISIALYGNLLGFIFLFFLIGKNLNEARLRTLGVFIVFVFYSFVNFDFYVSSTEPYKALFYALVAVSLSVEFYKIDFIKLLSEVFFQYIVFIAFLFFLGWGIDDAGGSFRIQGLMSEPSALSFILCFLFWKFFNDKSYVKLLIVLFVSILTLSLTVYIHFAIFYLVNLFLKLNLRSLFKLSLIFFLFLLFILILLNVESDFWLINKLKDAILFIQSGGMEGKNTRVIEKSLIFEDQNQGPLSFYIGNGPNFGVYYYSIRDMLTTTHSLVVILFFNFGIIGAVLGVLWLIFAFFRLRNSHYEILFVSAATYSLINTASGIVNDVYLYSLLFYSINLILSREYLLFTQKGN